MKKFRALVLAAAMAAGVFFIQNNSTAKTTDISLEDIISINDASARGEIIIEVPCRHDQMGICWVFTDQTFYGVRSW